MNLNSSNELLDSILNNLQKLTPEQEKIKDEIRQKSDELKAGWKEITQNQEE